MPKHQSYDVNAYGSEDSQSSNYYEKYEFDNFRPDMVADVKHIPRQSENSPAKVSLSKLPHINKVRIAVIVTGVLITGAIVAVTVVLNQKDDGDQNPEILHSTTPTEPTTPPTAINTSMTTTATTSTTAQRPSDATTSTSTTQTTTLNTTDVTTSKWPSDATTSTSTTQITTLNTTDVTTSKGLSDATTSTSTTQMTTLNTTDVNTSSTGWMDWKSWTSCSTTCGNGIHKRYRTCSGTLGVDCIGEYVQTEICSHGTCPAYGVWTKWVGWGNCDITCGGGTQIRTRTCSKSHSDDLDCAGSSLQQQTCSTWDCPDCNRVCTSGTLGQDCTICECSNIIEGRVIVNSSGDPISNANIFSASAPTNLLTTSNSTGFFTLNTTCDDSEVFVTREGFQDVTTFISTTNSDIVMDVKILPYLIQEPKPRQRLIGENLTLCCLASGKPPISYYEWFKDSLVLDRSLYPGGRELSLQNLESLDSGVYTCRANSPAGSIMSPEAKLTVEETPDEFCTDAFQSKTIALPDDCIQSLTNSATYEVADCVTTRCRGYNDLNSDSKCGKDAYSCCTVGEMKFETVQCSDYELQVLVVKSCVCGYCATSSLRITGTVISFEDNAAIKYAEIYVNDNYVTFTNNLGNFYLTLSEQTDRVTISVYDNFIQQHLPAVNVYYFTEEMHGSLSVTIEMVKIPDPIYLDSTTPNTLTVNNPTVEGTPSVELALPANSFYYSNGTQFNGTVSAFFKYFNPTNDSDIDAMPGEFRYVDEEGQTGELDSLGIFSLEFHDENGNNVIVNNVIDVYIPSELEANGTFELWNLNLETGGWDVLSTDTSQRRRKKRGWSPILVGEIDSSRLRSNFINIDRRRKRSDTCYVKSRIYKESDFREIEIYTTKYASVQTNIVEGSVLLRFYENFLYPETFCHTTLCPDLDGYVAIKYFQQSGHEYLFAGEPLYSSSTLQYSILDDFYKDHSVLKIRHKATTSGPFYEDLQTCRSSSITQSHLRFFHKEIDMVFVTNLKYIPPQPITPPFDPRHIELSQLTWYPKDRGEGYAVCLFKIRIEFDSTGSVSESMKLQLKSIAGTRDSIKGKLYGITQRRIGREKNSQSICLEYKCSGVNDPIYERGVDYTKVDVMFSYPVLEMTCQISQGSSVSQPGGNEYKGVSYEFLAPSGSNTDKGLYRIASDVLDLDKAQKIALQECLAGEKSSEDPNEFAGVGITISCT